MQSADDPPSVVLTRPPHDPQLTDGDHHAGARYSISRADRFVLARRAASGAHCVWSPDLRGSLRWEGNSVVTVDENNDQAVRKARRRSPGRQPRAQGGRRHRADVKMSDEEAIQIQARAISLNLSVPRLLVESA
ncbi:hypothetical protein AB0K09_03690, partial [Streptomyces sp. NPDC049577]|uniref:hypothetical protein n=1 Tax=Streptomyces sp. NPDC049577 TaxID=3155153 RepID=UPI003446ED5B